MKTSLLCLFSVIFLSVVFSAPTRKVRTAEEDDYPTTLIEYTNTRTSDTYEYKYFLSDGSRQIVKGTLKDVNGTKVYSVKGQYAWDLPDYDDLKLVVEYEADENGYRIVKIYAYNSDRVISSKAIESLLG